MMANDFAADDRCIALWRFESGTLTVDSKNSNTLTAVSSPTEEVADYREGVCSTKLVRASGQYFKIIDANLPVNFPFKSGGSERNGTYAGWFKFNSTGGDQGLLGKLIATGSCGVFQYNGTFYLDWNNSWQSTGIPVATGIWYHVAVRMEGNAGASSVRIYRASDGQIFNYSKTNWSVLTPGTSDFKIGSFASGNTLDGLVDEVVVLNRILSNDEIDAVRNQTYIPPPPYVAVTDSVIISLYEKAPAVKINAAQLFVLWNDVPLTGNLTVDGAGALVLWTYQLPPKRKFPIFQPKVRYQTQFNCRKFPIVV